MLRVLGAAVIGAIAGAGILAAVVACGGDPAITIPIPQANGSVQPQSISLGAVISKLAVILGVCTGALVGAMAGLAATREALAETTASTGRMPRG